jgi:hypothetical protein
MYPKDVGMNLSRTTLGIVQTKSGGNVLAEIHYGGRAKMARDILPRDIIPTDGDNRIRNNSMTLRSFNPELTGYVSTPRTAMLAASYTP